MLVLVCMHCSPRHLAYIYMYMHTQVIKQVKVFGKRSTNERIAASLISVGVGIGVREKLRLLLYNDIARMTWIWIWMEATQVR